MQKELLMQRCIDLATRGKGKVAPNPMVGAVLLHKGQIVAEGWHKGYGQDHAEIDALNHLPAHIPASECVLVVNLEPCSHYGKTPPCSLRIIQERISEVWVGSVDPNPLVAGKGLKMLTEAGIVVHHGILENECRSLNRHFYCFHEQKRPWITLKWARTANGFLGKESYVHPDERIISNEYSQQFSHKIRTEHQAILVGRKTIQTDNPQLSSRYWPGSSPLRIILDPNNWIHGEAHVLNDGLPTWILTRHINERNGAVRRIAFGMDYNLDSILKRLYDENIQSLIVEGGASTLQEFISKQLWDEIWEICSPGIWKTGIPAPVMPLVPKNTFELSSDLVRHYLPI